MAESTQTESAAEQLERQRASLLDAALRHVPFDGWTWTAIDAGARDLSLAPGEAQRLFPGGPQALIRAFSAAGDRRMLEALEDLDLASMKVREKVAAGVRARLEAVAAHREAVRSGLAFFALPQNAAAGLACLYRTVDAICGVQSAEMRHQDLVSQYKNLWMRWTYLRQTGDVPLFYTTAAAIRRDAFLRVGGFDEGYATPNVEDTAFGQKLARMGMSVRVQPALEQP